MLGRAVAPYALLAPAAVAIGVILGYPMYLLVRMSFEKYGLFELIRHQGRWVGCRPSTLQPSPQAPPWASTTQSGR